jgi:hypothetical protein
LQRAPEQTAQSDGRYRSHEPEATTCGARAFRTIEKICEESLSYLIFHLPPLRAIGTLSTTLSVHHGDRQRNTPDPAAGLSGETYYGLSPLLNDTLACFFAPNSCPFHHEGTKNTTVLHEGLLRALRGFVVRADYRSLHTDGEGYFL